MGVATTAELEERAAREFEKFRRLTYRMFLLSMVTLVVTPGMALVQRYDDGSLHLSVLIAAVTGLGAFLWCYMRMLRGWLHGRVDRQSIAFGGVAAGALSVMILSHGLWTLVPIFWAATAAPLLRTRRWTTLVILGTAAWCTPFILAVSDRPLRWYADPAHWYVIPLAFGILAVSCAVVVFINRYQMRMWDLHQEAHASRQAQARLAVTEERLRFSRDLHDLLGHSLSLIAVKSELAMRMAEADPARARAEMADVRTAARGALREVRAAVRGYRAVELDAELAGVRAVLEAAGVRCETAPPPDLPPEIRSVLAWVIREGATNVIKHSEARHCRISLALYGESVVLEMSNDGVRSPRGDAGSGLTGLTERVRVVGGELTAGRDGRDGFLLRVVIPLPAEDAVELAESGSPV
ncbi:sensor histidine kinase [Actinomadura rudentiformis]|uniref:Sensor histidine kinase n=1 Tax=Actinomadura rudentiformis TaxID=359158 RepID=A0A6H9YJY1_9ACTN|nr:sensor histidine kinase [Actinomadura rudentiformis]KAB2343071.1 sensor histidine kinase [Actinomadura rudentiformis]